MGADRTTDWEPVTKVGARTTSLSFAVRLVDAVTGRSPGTGEGVSLDLANSPVEPVENPSGFHLFLDVETDPVTLSVDGGDRYEDRSLTVYHASEPPGDETDARTRTDAVRVVLDPAPGYAFPAGSTRVRGRVTDGPPDSAPPVADATVSLEGYDRSAVTTATGEYVLPVPVTAATVVRVGTDRYVTSPSAQNTTNGSGQPGNNRSGNGPRGNGPGDGQDDPPTLALTVERPDGSTGSTDVSVLANALTTVDVDATTLS